MSRGSLLTDLTMRLASTGAPLLAFNALIARPPGVERKTGLAYGPLPRHRLDVYRPASQEVLPLMVFLHGGAWEVGSRAEYAFAGRSYAAEGFVAVVPDYRLTRHAPFPAFLEDCARAVAWCQVNAERLGADPTRTVLGGHSAGAYNAAMLALDGRWLGRAQAVHPVRAWVGLSGPYDFLPLESGPGLRTFGHVADLTATQPIAYVGPRSPPAFLATGRRDQLVRPGNTERLSVRLRDAGVEVETHIHDDAGHAEPLLALAWPRRHRLPVLAESAAFLRNAL
jgi:acetyl esterase/lipase